MDPFTLVKLWMLVKPIQRIRLARARRRARKAGEVEPVSLSEENVVFPKGTMTKSGVVIAFLGPLLTVGLTAFGVTDSVVQDQVVQAGGMLVTAIGSVIAWKGRNRATP